jgi:hypothetical protein
MTRGRAVTFIESGQMGWIEGETTLDFTGKTNERESGASLSAACPTQAQKRGLNGAPNVRCQVKQSWSSAAEYDAEDV